MWSAYPRASILGKMHSEFERRPLDGPQLPFGYDGRDLLRRY